MGQQQVEILLVEDNPDDLELALHALRKGGLANQVEVARDGEQALDFLFCRGPYAHRSATDPPKLVLLDLKLPKGERAAGAGAVERQPHDKSDSHCDCHSFPRRTGFG